MQDSAIWDSYFSKWVQKSVINFHIYKKNDKAKTCFSAFWMRDDFFAVRNISDILCDKIKLANKTSYGFKCIIWLEVFPQITLIWLHVSMPFMRRQIMWLQRWKILLRFGKIAFDLMILSFTTFQMSFGSKLRLTKMRKANYWEEEGEEGKKDSLMCIIADCIGIYFSDYLLCWIFCVK